MTVEKYRPEDFAQIAEWGEKWGANYRPEQFPKTGVIIHGIAAYFLYSTDSSICWLENLISNPDADGFMKARALDMLVDAILDEAVRLGFKVAYATTDVVSVAKRAKANGAAVVPAQMLLIKDLTKPAHLQ